MSLITKFISLFTEDNHTLIDPTPKETFSVAKLNYKIEKFKLSTFEIYYQTIEEICKKLESDTFEFIFRTLDKDISEPNCSPDFRGLYDKKSLNDDLRTKLQDEFQYLKDKEFEDIDESEYLHLEIKFSKPESINPTHRIYLFNYFIDYLDRLNLKEILEIFSKRVHYNNKVIFFIDESENEFYTNNIFFVHSIESINTYNIQNGFDTKAIEEYKFNCRFIGCDLKLTPYSFKFNTKSRNEKINLLFNKLLFIISIVNIANYSEFIDNNTLKIHLQGYKLITKTIDYKGLINPNDSIFNIFHWIYKDGNINDRLILSRNIMTLELDYSNSLLSVDNNTLASIQSNHSIYLQENTEKYIDLKAKITDSIIDISIKSGDIISDFASSFKNNFIATFSFIFTIFIAGIFSENPQYTNLFNRDVSIVLLFINSISYIYLIVSLNGITSDLKHYNEIIKSLKKSYKSLLSPKDLDNIFSNDILKNNLIHISEKITEFSTLWVLLIFSILPLLIFLSDYFRTLLFKNIDISILLILLATFILFISTHYLVKRVRDVKIDLRI